MSPIARPLVIRPLAPGDHEAWRRLWAGYLRFYRAELSEAVTHSAWQRLLDPASPLRGLVAEAQGQVIGLCHSLLHASTWTPQPVCYLQDLFVAPEARGSGAARALIDAAEAAARREGCALLYWQTQEYNGPARSLYDTITPRSAFIVYEKPL